MRLVEVAACQARPIGFIDALRVDFLLPENLDFFTLRVILETGEADKRLVARRRRRFARFRGNDCFRESAVGLLGHNWLLTQPRRPHAQTASRYEVSCSRGRPSGCDGTGEPRRV